MATLALLILFCLSSWTCQKPKLQLIALGGERAVGKINEGVIVWEADVNPDGSYIIVTKGLIKKFAAAMAKNWRLTQELKIERARQDKKQWP